MAREPDNGEIETADFPAAILCATCGAAECLGCAPRPRVESAGAAAQVPWEQESPGRWQRLWTTARRSTVAGESFFAELTEGALLAPLGFALACELLAIASVAAAWTPIVVAFAPEFFSAVWEDSQSRQFALSLVGAAVPAFAVLMVLLHVVWGAALEVAIGLQGRGARMAFGMRYALYACGWDLLTSPFGVAAGFLEGGMARALSEARMGVRVPRPATLAYLRDARRLDEAGARRAVWTAGLATGALVLAGAGSAVAATVSLLLTL